LLRAPKSSITLGSYWKQSASEARGGHQFDKPAELNYETGGSAGSLEEQAQFRLQSIRQDTGPLTNRFSWFNTLALRPHPITSTLQSRIRFDSNAYVGKNNFAWGRAEAGMYWQPSTHFGLGAAYAPGFEVGHSQFSVDRLLSTNAANLRADLNLGPRKISYLLAYDLDGRGEFDHEFNATQAMGCLEFYVLYRRVTGTYQIGLRLRTQELVDKLKLRREQRERPTETKPATGTTPPQ
jgi:hypothetical protein